MKHWLALSLIMATALAIALRWPDLDRRPMHHDESVNARIFQGLWEQGVYRYNPDEYHGPTLHYATLPMAWLSGAKDFDQLSERTLRAVAVIAGVAMVLLVLLLRDGLGPTATGASALLLALSPAMVFYSRYFIHEMLLAAGTLLFLGGAWRYGRTQRAGWAIVAGAALGWMHATKETFVINLAGMGVAVVLILARQRWLDRRPITWREHFRPGHLLLAAGTAALVSLALFTSFGTHWRGPWDSVTTYLPWLRRAGGESPHLHPWYFYFQRLFWYHAAKGPHWTEAIIGLLALSGGVAALNRSGRWAAPRASSALVQFLLFYTFAVAAAYSVIAYKTPWCLLNFLLPMILLAGCGADALLHWAGLGRPPESFPRAPHGDAAPGDTFPPPRGENMSAKNSAVAGYGSPPPRPRTLPQPAVPSRLRLAATGALLFIGIIHLAWQSWQASHGLTNDRGNPYIYAQTLPNTLELVKRVQDIAGVSPLGRDTRVHVIAPNSEYWPLPWYLRQLRNVWWMDALPEDPYAPIIIVAAKLKAGLDDRSQRRYLSVGYYELRPREFLELYVEFELWKRYVATLPRPSDDDAEDSPLSP
ncbi:MAG: TIGR03663 family protein [Verrucomicrobiales bacterium]|nr:TIGR03663 family protein [Verrucomicrobiales bacterium]